MIVPTSAKVGIARFYFKTPLDRKIVRGFFVAFKCVCFVLSSVSLLSIVDATGNIKLSRNQQLVDAE